MKITVYELLGLIKDGQAPKKIKWRDKIWLYYDRDQDYEINDNDLLGYGFCNYKTLDFINDTVEIAEEEKKVEKLDLDYKSILHEDNIKFKEEILMYCDNLQRKINNLIDEINKLKEDK